MKKFSLKLLLISLTIMALHVITNAQTNSVNFKIDNSTYFLHLIKFHDLSADDPKLALWNQTIVADENYIYLADNTDNSANHLTIKRYNAITGIPDTDLTINQQDMDYWLLSNISDEERCFYLIDCNDKDHLILFLNTPNEGILADSEFYFYLLNKNGRIVREFIATTDKIDYKFISSDIADFGIPQIIGNAAEGNFEILIPMVNSINYMAVAKYSFKDNKQSGLSVVNYDYSQKHRNTKPSVSIIDDTYFIIDDIDIAPSIYSYKVQLNNCFGTLNSPHIAGHGCNILNFDGHRLIYSGDIYYPENDTEGTTCFNLGQWEKSSTENQNINFDNHKPLTTLSFGKSIFNSKSPFSYTYRQFIAVSDYGTTTKHLHFYVPGEFLATYQLNKHDFPTSIGNIIDNTDNNDIKISIQDKELIFNRPIDDVLIFNIYGRIIFQSNKAVKTINLTNFVKGVYLVKTPHKTFKIFL